MEFSEIKSRVIGYSKKDVFRYIGELNDLHLASVEALEANHKKEKENYVSQIESLNESTAKLSETINTLETELNMVKEQLEAALSDNKAITADYEELSRQTEEIRSKSDVISTAIINAEKCATSMISDANTRAKDMIEEAQEKVDGEVKRLETTRGYISEVRDAVEIALKKIDAELGTIEDDILSKTRDVSSVEETSRKNSVKEKFGMLEKTLFKRA